MIDWLDGWERYPSVHNGGGMVGGAAPWRGVLHTTEGEGMDGALHVLLSRYSPQLVVDPVSKRRAQLLPLTIAGAALEHPFGVETNRMNAVQIEICGFAADVPNWPADWLAWLGEEVLKPVMAAAPIQAVAPAFVGAEAGTIATPTAPQRMSTQAWSMFGGWCGHQHIPNNSHWDPGHLNIHYVLATALGGVMPDPAPAIPTTACFVVPAFRPEQRWVPGALSGLGEGHSFAGWQVWPIDETNYGSLDAIPDGSVTVGFKVVTDPSSPSRRHRALWQGDGDNRPDALASVVGADRFVTFKNFADYVLVHG